MSKSVPVRLPQAGIILPWIAFLFATRALGAGIWITESGGADMTMASAGRAALAADPSTLAANPAGIAALSGRHYLAALLPSSLDAGFEGVDGTYGTADNRADALAAGSLFAVQGGRRLSAGAGIYGYLGLRFDFGEEWVGRRVIEDADLRTINVAAAVAYRVTDRIDLGVTVAAQNAELDAALAVGNEATYYGPPEGLDDGQLRITGESWAPVVTVGLAYDIASGTRLGAAWTSSVRHSIDSEVRAQDLHPALSAVLQQSGPVALDVTLPQQAVLSVTRRSPQNTVLAASVGWQDWSSFGRARLAVGDHRGRLFPRGLEDTWHVAAGLRQPLDPRWTLGAGVAYDSDPSADGSMPAYFPIADQLRLAAGVDCRVSSELVLRLALSVIQQGTVRVAQREHPLPLPGIAPLYGRFDGSRVYVIGLAAQFAR